MMNRALKQIGLAAILALLLVVTAHAIDSAPAFDDPVLQSRYEKLTRELRCLVCQNETIADSNASLAGDLRRELRNLIASGKSDEEVLKFLTDRYGDFVLYKPPFVARTWILWATPVLALLAAVGIALVVIRRRAKLPIDSEINSERATPPGTNTP
jgi:cytochrome c-type biogenesis protein CcmH